MASSERPVALITGGGSGLGAAAAEQFAQLGYDVVLVGRRREQLMAVADRIRTHEANVAVAPADIADITEFSKVTSALERLDVVVNSAGIIGPISMIEDTDPHAWAAAVTVNLIGSFNVAHCTIPLLLSSAGGTFISVGSGASAKAIPGWSSYCASKAGLAMFARSMAQEYQALGLRVFSFNPGLMDTPMRETIRSEDPARRNEVRSALTSPEEVARMITWLCRGDADRFMGQEVSFDDLKQNTLSASM